MKSTFYKIHCITNLHMGSGDINFNVIDNEVERDPVNNWPVMFSSGVKGAMRDHFRNLGADRSVIRELFGSDINRGPQDNSYPGKICFLTAYILLLPFRSPGFLPLPWRSPPRRQPHLSPSQLPGGAF